MATRISPSPAVSGVSLDTLRETVLPITRAHGVRNVRLFGSFVRGEQRAGSDVDLLVDLPRGMSLLDLAGLQMELEGVLGRKVDVIPSTCIKPALRESILSEARPL